MYNFRTRVKRKRYGEEDDEDDEEMYQENDKEYKSYEEKSLKITKSSIKKNITLTSSNSSLSSSISTTSSLTSSFEDYSNELKLKPDHKLRPIWITKNNLIILESFSPLYQQACDFLITIAEPETRPRFIHTYKLTETSLFSAVAVGITTENILKILNRLNKTNLPQEVITFINNTTQTYGKAKIVLKKNRFYIESQYPEILREFLKHPYILSSRDYGENLQSNEGGGSGENKGDNLTSLEMSDGFIETESAIEDVRNLESYTKLCQETFEEDENEFEDENYTKKIKKNINILLKKNTLINKIKKITQNELNYPLLEEYDFKNDTNNNTINNFELKISTRIRPYQEKALGKIFSNGRARSGIIVLPCGAGKSLTGITACFTVKKSCIILCINNASVKQWQEQFYLWTTLEKNMVKVFTSNEKENLPDNKKEPCIVITTYSMICHSGKRSERGERMIESIREREWGLMVLDEVHVAPAEMFQKVVHMVNAHCKLGLTATLVREDDKISDLGFLVGPKLYEANWIDLTNKGYLAKVKCVEVWCPMTQEFYAEYIKLNNPSAATGSLISGRSRLQRLLYILNPNKFRLCEYLLKYHIQKNNKIIIFSDDVPALMIYCEGLKKIIPIPYIYGETSEKDRRDILSAFKNSDKLLCIGLSKVGDTALDIPEANVIIQISSHFGARRQEAQRLGRILRPKPNPTGGFNAFFYTLISTDTKEMYFSMKRQQYLIDQGYTFKVIQDLTETANKQSVLLTNKQHELDLLNKILSFDYESYDNSEEKKLSKLKSGEIDMEEEGGEGVGSASSGISGVKRKVTKISNLTGGGQGQFYTEYNE